MHFEENKIQLSSEADISSNHGFVSERKILQEVMKNQVDFLVTVLLH